MFLEVGTSKRVGNILTWISSKMEANVALNVHIYVLVCASTLKIIELKMTSNKK